MRLSVRWGGAVLTAVLALGALAPAADAQFLLPGRGVVPPANTLIPTPPGQQVFANLFYAGAVGRTIRQFPPWAFGYNPYARIINAGPQINTMPLGGLGFPSTLSTYAGLGGLGGYPSTATLDTNPYGYDSSLSTMPSNNGGYGGYGGYQTPYYEDPVSGFLRGSSDIIRANGAFLKDAQTARLIQTQADESRIDFRRRLIDEARYERGLLPTTEEIRQQDIARDLARARHEPPISDIISAKSLNDILHHLNGDPGRGKGQDVRIPDGVLEHVTVTSPTLPGASLGLLRDDGKLAWPAALEGKEFAQARDDLSKRLQSVVQEDLRFANPVPSGKVMDLNTDLTKLRTMVEKSDLSPSDYIAAKSYLDQVGGAIEALKDPNAAANFNHKFNAKNVAELVDGMKGLDFAPAAPGDEWAYRVLHQALVAYDYSASPQQPPQQPAPAPPPPPGTAPKPPY